MRISGRSHKPDDDRRRPLRFSRGGRILGPQPTPSRPPPGVTGRAGMPRWQPGDRIIWRDCAGQYLRDVENGQAHVLIGARTYLVALGELQPG